MIAVTFNGAPAWLLAFLPHWGRAVSLTARVPSESARSLSGREFREPVGASLRCALAWESLLDASALNRLRDAAEAYADEPVIAPVWPLALPGDSWPGLVDGAVTVGWDDGGAAWELNPATPGDWDWVAPAIVGRWDPRQPEILAPEAATVEFYLEEDAEAQWALAPSPVSWDDGPALNDTSVPKRFPFAIDWARQPRSAAPVMEVTRRSIGVAPRTRAAVFYPQNGATRVEAFVSLDAYWEIAKLLRWWQDMRGAVGAHYVLSPPAAARLGADAAAGATSISIVPSGALGDYRYLALTDALGNIEYVRVSGISGHVCTLVSPLVSAWPAATTSVCLGVLARHAADVLEIRFASPGYGACTLSWTELPEEYVIADLSTESRGGTVGAGAARAWLYQITVDRGSSSTVHRFTSYERDLTADGQTWSAEPLSHSDVSASIRLDRDELTLSGRWLSWCEPFLPGRLAARVLLDIKECDVSGSTGSNVSARWSGEVSGIEADGPLVKATAKGPYAVFDRPCPRYLMQRGCNHVVYDDQCGVSRSQWEFGAVVTAASGASVTLGTWTRVDAGALPSGFGFAQWFAMGYLDRAAQDRQTILRSTALASGLITLTLDRSPVAAFAVGEAVVVVPWCDGRPESCKAYHASTNPTGRFANWARFGGFPELPTKNPSFTGLRKTESAYGKK